MEGGWREDGGRADGIVKGRWREDGGRVDGMVELKGKWNRVEGRKQKRKKGRRGGREEIIERSGIDLCNCPPSICSLFLTLHSTVWQC